MTPARARDGGRTPRSSAGELHLQVQVPYIGCAYTTCADHTHGIRVLNFYVVTVPVSGPTERRVYTAYIKQKPTQVSTGSRHGTRRFAARHGDRPP